ncbi:NAD(P)-dependent nickel-iron dehydrogenase catalytic subunit [Geothermobacter ehrlichii]|uniref:NAD(P)-dependent nickel-iron dehydrogenase catalytic subunit n=1 Tax=Geothermobacter ehrlichii TaxID=213224 RepID=A0A5D3WLD6_9BACT|nr:Ni/Fe hydrogenase subunit alpha [Geothermobacter ehrlichii]TYO99247.1 NAD(P)-dependent nickel-iron dehydrogenase catalytic subunit [Geothermobacter ehrlichii]
MSRTVTIEPITRIEGHAKITILLDEQQQVADARFHVTEFRGFERFCIGRSFWEMPGITARVCGICPVSHLIASSKAGDAILGVRTPETAVALRRLMNYGQLVQSHALSFFLLSGPDLILGMDADPASRNLVGLIRERPELARAGIRLRSFGQQLIRALGERSIHPSWSVPGGVRRPLAAAERDRLLGRLPEMYRTVDRALDLMKETLDRFHDELPAYGDFPSLFLGLVGPDGGLEHYDGLVRVIDAEGRVLEAGLEPERYEEIIAEAEQPWTYLKFPYYRPLGLEDDRGMYRVGPLARLNVCDFAGTPRADRELRQFRHYGGSGRPVTGSFYYHYARLIEILFSLERIEELLADGILVDHHIRSRADVNQNVGIGVSEAPRGTLFHRYRVDDDGILEDVNLLIATGQNNLAMNRTVRQLARHFIRDGRLEEGLLNRIEHGIRTFDPCLSCSTHVVGQMPLLVELRGPGGELLERIERR